MTKRRCTPCAATKPTPATIVIPPYHQRGSFILSFIFIVLVIMALVVSTWYVIRQDRLITQKFEGKRWNLPAKVYSRPLELSQGTTLSDKQLQLWLDLLNYRKTDNYDNTGTFTKKTAKDKCQK